MIKTGRSFNSKMMLCALLATVLTTPVLAAAPKAPVSPRPLENADPSYPPQPAFFVVKDNDSILYILGSQHKIRKHTKWLTPQVRNAFFESDRVWFEITMEDSSHPILQIKSMRQGQAEEGKTLPAVLTPEEYKRTVDAAASVGLEMSELDQYKPWLVGDILRGTFQAKFDEKKYNQDSSSGGVKETPSKDDTSKDNPESKDASTTSDQTAVSAPAKTPASTTSTPKRPPALQGGVEDMLELMTIDKPTYSVENVERHVMLFDNLSLEVQRKYLMNAIEEMEDKTDEMKALSRAWRRGDLATLANGEVAKMKVDNEQFYDVMLRLRNIEMTDRAEEIMKGSGTDFFVVGAAHLAGPDSVLEMLKARGYRATRLYDSQVPVATHDPNRMPEFPLYHVVPEPMPKLEVQLLPAAADKPGQPRLRLMANYVTNGCGEYLPLLHKIRKDGNIFEIRTAGGTLFVNPPQDRTTCGPASKLPYVDIPLDVAEMKTAGVSSLWMMRGGGMDKFEVEFTDDTISITPPEKLRYFKTRKYAPMTASWSITTPAKSEKKVEEKLVVANVPATAEVAISLSENSIKMTDTIKKQIEALMVSRGFVPAENGHYIDQGGQFAFNLQHIDMMRVGTITLDDGRTVAVMVHRP